MSTFKCRRLSECFSALSANKGGPCIIHDRRRTPRGVSGLRLRDLTSAKSLLEEKQFNCTFIAGPPRVICGQVRRPPAWPTESQRAPARDTLAAVPRLNINSAVRVYLAAPLSEMCRQTVRTPLCHPRHSPNNRTAFLALRGLLMLGEHCCLSSR